MLYDNLDFMVWIPKPRAGLGSKTHCEGLRYTTFYSKHSYLWNEELMLLNCGVGEDSWETVRRSNQSILKEISPECSLEGLMLKLKFQYFGHLMRRADSFEKPLMLEDWSIRESSWERLKAGGKGLTEMVGWHHWLSVHEFEQTPGEGDSEGQGTLACCSPWVMQRVRHDLVTEQQQKRTWVLPEKTVELWRSWRDYRRVVLIDTTKKLENPV